MFFYILAEFRNTAYSNHFCMKGQQNAKMSVSSYRRTTQTLNMMGANEHLRNLMEKTSVHCSADGIMAHQCVVVSVAMTLLHF